MTEPPDKLTIETPEQIPLEFPLAGIGSRFLAAALDYLIQSVAALGLLVAGMIVLAGGPRFSSRVHIWLGAMAVLVFFLLQFGYFAGFEAWWNGQTPGKRRLHLRVIKDSGRPIAVYESVARNLLRIVDSLPGLYGVGIVAMLLSSQNKRLGDYVAGTVVVHEQPLADQAKVSWTFSASGAPSGYDIAQLSPEEFQLMETFLLRREQLAPEVRAAMARRVALRIGAKLQIPTEERRNPEALLERLANEYRNRARFL
jgi:uncharacterized RDD family membrane protein YckC